MRRIWLVTFILLSLGDVQRAQARELTPYRGASLNSPLDPRWPWQSWASTKPQVTAYLDRLQSLKFNAVRLLLRHPSDSPFVVEWDASAQQALAEFIDLAATRGIRVLFWLDFVVPQGDDDPNYDAIVALGKTFADLTVGHLAAARPRSEAIAGWTIGNGENPWSLSIVAFVRELALYVRSIDPYHPIGAEAYNTSAGVLDGQLLGLESSNGNAAVAQRSWYGVMDYASVSQYDLADGTWRAPLNAANLLVQMNLQNPANKPILIEEYGNKLNDHTRGEFLSQLVNSTAATGRNVQAVYIWDAQPEWNDAVLPPAGSNNYGLFWYNTGQPYNLGANKAFTRLLGERHAARPWASYSFEDLTNAAEALNAQSSNGKLSLLGNAVKGAGYTGRGLVLDGSGDYATTAYTSSMNQARVSIEAAVKPSVWKWSNGIACRNGVFCLFLGGDGKLKVWANTGSGWAPKGSSVATVPTNTWSRVGARYDGVAWRYYINGVLDASVSDPGSIVAGTDPLHIGANGGQIPFSTDYFQGSIDEVSIGAVPDAFVRFSCDEGSGTTLGDGSGNALSATLFGGTIWPSQTIGDGWSIDFNGTNGYASVSGSSAHRYPTIAVDFYMRADNPGSSYQYVVSQGRDYYGSGWNVYLYQGMLGFLANTDNLDNGSEVQLALPYTDTGWHHVHASYDGATARLTVDGQGVSTAGSGPIVYRNNELLTLGRLAFGSFYYFDGALDQVEVYAVPW